MMRKWAPMIAAVALGAAVAVALTRPAGDPAGRSERGHVPKFAGGIGVTMLIGAVAGLYPAIRASKTPPTAALNG
ncbi:hypothetical protein [Nonomuraea sp. NPDC049695]|uniref:hypothetical protein n=1 Tax=Nonomuraea sp. NPDC049695 TaxID=3154734 RepID=UPI00341FD9AC